MKPNEGSKNSFLLLILLSRFCSNLYNLRFHNLVKHFPEMDYLEHLSTTITMLNFLKHLNYFPENKKNDDEVKIGQILSHYFAAVKSNAHVISELQRSPENGTKLDTIGIGLFLNVSSHFNHSCDPNTFTIYQGRDQITVAARTILPGEEICHIYFGHFGDTSKEKRQEHLMRNYHFKCLCDACENDYPNAKECLESGKTFSSTTTENLQHPLCKEKLEELDEKIKKLNQISRTALSKNMVPLAVEATKKQISLISENLKKPHILYVLSRFSIVNFMCFMYGNKSRQVVLENIPHYF